MKKGAFGGKEAAFGCGSGVTSPHNGLRGNNCQSGQRRYVCAFSSLSPFFCIFSTSITLNSVQKNCSLLSPDSLPIAMMTTRVIHPSLNWFLLHPLQAAVLVSTSCVFSHSNCVYCVTHEDIALI